MKRFLKVLFSFTSMFLLSTALYAQNKAFTWQLAVEQITESEPVLLDSTKPIALQNNDQFTVSLKSKADAYCTIILEDTDGIVSVLYNDKIAANKGMVLPADDGTAYSLVPPSGTDKVYICVSATKQTELITATAKLASMSEENKNYKKQSKKVLNALDKIKLQSTQLAESASKPATVGAVTRSIAAAPAAGDTDSTADATAGIGTEPVVEAAKPEHFSNQNVYLKTIRITH